MKPFVEWVPTILIPMMLSEGAGTLWLYAAGGWRWPWGAGPSRTARRCARSSFVDLFDSLRFKRHQREQFLSPLDATQRVPSDRDDL